MTFSRTEVVASLPPDSPEVQVLRLVECVADMWPKIDNAILSKRWHEGRPLTFKDIGELESMREFFALSEQVRALTGEVVPESAGLGNLQS